MRSKGLTPMRRIVKLLMKYNLDPGTCQFGLRDSRYFITSPEVQEITSSFSQTVGSKEGIFTRSSVVNTDEKSEFKLLAMLESSVKTSSPTFNDTKSLVTLRLRLT